MAKKKIQKSVDGLIADALIPESKQPYEIPGNWVWVCFELVKKNEESFGDGDWILSKNLDQSGDVRLIQLGDIGIGQFLNKSSKYITSKTFDELNCTEIFEGDILISRMAHPIARSCILPKLNNRLITAVDVAYLRVDPNLTTNQFINYACNSNFFQNQSEKVARGTTRKRITRKNLAKLPFPLPPLPEQKRIVTKLSTMLEKLKQAKELIQEAKDSFERRRAAILHLAFTGGLTREWRLKHHQKLAVTDEYSRLQRFKQEWLNREIANGNNEAKTQNSKLKRHSYTRIPDDEIPSSWISSSLLKICALVVDCHNKTAPYEDEGIPLIRTSNIKKGVIDIVNTKYISQKTYEFWSRRCPPEPGDIIFTREAPMGESGIIPPNVKLCMGQRMMLLRFFNEYSNVKFFDYALKDTSFQNRMIKKAVGTGVKHLRVGDVETLTVPIPPLEEQNEIVRILDTLLDNENEASSLIELEDEIELLEKSILSKAFRGELDTNDPEDEPAGELLKRILQERKEAPKKKPPRKASKPKPKSVTISAKPLSVKVSAQRAVITTSKEAQYLFETIKDKMGKQAFSINELKSVVDLSFEELKTALFELIKAPDEMNENSTLKMVWKDHKYILQLAPWVGVK